jgi:hypothetical protein
VLPLIISQNNEPSFLMEALKTLVQICKAFPVLIEESVVLLTDISPPNLGSFEGANTESRLAKATWNTFQEIVKLKQPPI